MGQLTDLNEGVVIVYISGGVAQWSVSDTVGMRVIIIDHDKHAEEEYEVWDIPIDPLQSDQWDPEILNALEQHLREPWPTK